MWGDNGVVVTCHYCQLTGPTVVNRSLTSMGWCWCIAICCIFWPCVCVVCCIDSLNTYVHSCQNCNRPLGARNAGMPIYY